MRPRILLNELQVSLAITRLCYQLIENHDDFSGSVLVGVQPRGVHLSDRICGSLKNILKKDIAYGRLDTTFYRDDFRRRDNPLAPNDTDIDFSIEDKKVVLVDDVLYTGRTIRAAMDALLDFGRPAEVELLVLIDRRFTRHLPVQADYVGKTIDSIDKERVKVEWKETDGEDKVKLYTVKEAQI